MRTLLLFLDGVGIGPADPSRNPFLVASLPNLQALLGAVPTLDDTRAEGRVPRGAPAVAFPLDATLETEGIPQSGTGQTALLTGVNAARAFGRHFGPWTPVRLRPLLEEANVFSRALERGRTAAFANAYPPSRPGDPPRRRPAAPPLAAQSAGLLTRHAEALADGNAVASEIVNDGWIEQLGHRTLPRVSPREAGANLAGIAARNDLTVFAHYSTDYAGHRGGMAGAATALERVDAFLGGLLDRLPADCLLLVASDHGNIEDVTTGHTRNPALGLLVGPDAGDRARRLESITDVAPALLSWTAEG